MLIKDYSENEGVLKALTDAGVVEPTGKTVEGGFVSLPVAKLNADFLKEYELEKAKNFFQKFDKGDNNQDKANNKDEKDIER